MNAETIEEMQSIAVKNPEIMEAFKVVQEVMSNPDEWRLYERQRDFLLVQETEEALAEKRAINAKEEGRKEGRIETAKAMIEAGFDIETVCKATGLNETDLTD